MSTRTEHTLQDGSTVTLDTVHQQVLDTWLASGKPVPFPVDFAKKCGKAALVSVMRDELAREAADIDRADRAAARDCRSRWSQRRSRR